MVQDLAWPLPEGHAYTKEALGDVLLLDVQVRSKCSAFCKKMLASTSASMPIQSCAICLTCKIFSVSHVDHIVHLLLWKAYRGVPESHLTGLFLLRS